MANIYERLYRTGLDRRLLEASNQAIVRVLGNERTPPHQRAEALALQGRNLKTRWRTEFSGLDTVQARRDRASDRTLVQSYEAYRSAFFVDLNNFYPGLSALQMGYILDDLAGAGAHTMFGRDAVKAHRYREDLGEQLASLRHIVTASTINALEREDSATKMWALISEAELLFFSSGADPGPDDTAEVVAAYRDAIPKGKAFAWDATRGQLELIASLGIRTTLAQKVLEEMDGRFPGPAKRPVHLVVFSGHTVDDPQTDPPRFPATVAAEQKARDLIRAKLEVLNSADEDLVVLASAAPGADILIHEVCAQVGVISVLCLPMPARMVAREISKVHPSWLARFHAVVGAHQQDAIVLGEESQDGQIPRWLRHRTADPWERGNRWTIKLAETWHAKRITLLALWDGRTPGSSTGGTAFMVQLATESGHLSIERLDSGELLTEAGI